MAKIGKLKTTITVGVDAPAADMLEYLTDKVDHQKKVIENLQGVQKQFIISAEKKDAEIKALKKGIVNFKRDLNPNDDRSDYWLLEDVLSYASDFYPDLEKKDDKS